jgi:ectoine hydroxylase-related dioxygenase (phytanoyl-CoA dioxygenase family)
LADSGSSTGLCNHSPQMSTVEIDRATFDARTDAAWLEKALGCLRYLGFAVVEGVMDDELVATTREAMYRVQERIRADVGEERLRRAGEHGVLRNMVAYDDHFLSLLELPEMLAVVDATVSPTAILHLQNGFVLPSVEGETESFQHTFHMDFPRYLNGYVASLNVMLTVDGYTALNGGTIVAPGTHQRPERPGDAYLEAAQAPVECGPGAMVVFDSTLWHAAGQNRSGQDRLGINHQFTRSFIKQQVDYVRALGDEKVEAQPPRTQQLLGWYTRVVTSLDEYYQPPEKRLYRSGQG